MPQMGEGRLLSPDAPDFDRMAQAEIGQSPSEPSAEFPSMFEHPTLPITTRCDGVARMATTKRGSGGMSDEHKAALAEGRNQGRAVRRYLEALEAHRPKRGRKRTPESMQKQLDRIEAEIPTADPLKRLQLIQQRLDLQQELASADETVDMEALEKDFVTAAGPYGARKGISYDAWRELGVPAATLKAAGITRAG
jgi:hypothetical protein